jgi:hypothetical protein
MLARLCKGRQRLVMRQKTEFAYLTSGLRQVHIRRFAKRYCDGEILRDNTEKRLSYPQPAVSALIATHEFGVGWVI